MSIFAILLRAAIPFAASAAKTIATSVATDIIASAVQSRRKGPISTPARIATDIVASVIQSRRKWPINTPARIAGGPVVKGGNRRGEVRDRTLLGRWRAKRSDAGIPRR